MAVTDRNFLKPKKRRFVKWGHVQKKDLAMPIALILSAALVISMLTADISLLVLLLVPRPKPDLGSKS